MTDEPRGPSYPGPDQPQVPAANQPPPGYRPPPSPGQIPPSHGQPAHTGGRAVPYAGWLVRVGAQIVDGLIALAVTIIPLIIGLVITLRHVETDPTTGEISGGISLLGILILALTFILYVGFDIWNRGVRVGTKGQSFGKQLLGVRIVRDVDGQLLGGGGGFVRWLMSFVLSITACVGLLDVLWPLWDDKKQTLHDKIVSSVPIRV